MLKRNHDGIFCMRLISGMYLSGALVMLEFLAYRILLFLMSNILPGTYFDIYNLNFECWAFVQGYARRIRNVFL